jgi:hypothetical protein
MSDGVQEPGQDITKIPEKSAADIPYFMGKAAVSMIPIWGAVVAEFYSAVLQPNVDDRKNIWVQNIAIAVVELRKNFEEFKAENLQRNENFLSAFMYAGEIAIRNHQREKLEALRNAVLNSVMPNAPIEDLQHMFLNFIDAAIQAKPE